MRGAGKQGESAVDASELSNEGSLTSGQISSLSRSIGRPSISRESNRPIFQNIKRRSLRRLSLDKGPNLSSQQDVGRTIQTTRASSGTKSFTLKFSFSPRPVKPLNGDNNSGIETIVTEFPSSKHSRHSRSINDNQKKSLRPIFSLTDSIKNFTLEDVTKAYIKPATTQKKRESIGTLENLRKNMRCLDFKHEKTVQRSKKSSKIGFEDLKKQIQNPNQKTESRLANRVKSLKQTNLEKEAGKEIFGGTHTTTLEQFPVTGVEVKRRGVLKDSLLDFGSHRSIKKVSFGGDPQIFQVPLKDESRRNIPLPKKPLDLENKASSGRRGTAISRFAANNFCPISSMIARETSIKQDLQESTRKLYLPKG